MDPANSDYDRFVSSEHIDRFDLVVRRWGKAAEIESSKKAFEDGDYLFVARSLYGSDFRERAARAAFRGVCSNGIIALRERHGHIADGFLSAVLNHPRIWDFIVRNATGTLTRYVYWKTLKHYEFPLPPLEEQRRLAELLRALSTAQTSVSDAIRNARIARDALIRHLYSRGTRSGSLHETELGTIPTGWTVEPLDSRFSVQLGKMVSEAARSQTDQTPYIRNANVQWNRLDLEDVATMSFNPRERLKFSLRHGDILACEGRHVGKSALWREEIPGACYQKALHRLRARGDDSPMFLLHCLYYYSITGRLAKVTGETTIPHLPAEKLRAMRFPFPPREEQDRIANAVESFDEGLSSLESRQAGLSALVRGAIEVAGE